MNQKTSQKPPQHKFADLWMLALLLIVFWPFLLIGWTLDILLQRKRQK